PSRPAPSASPRTPASSTSAWTTRACGSWMRSRRAWRRGGTRGGRLDESERREILPDPPGDRVRMDPMRSLCFAVVLALTSSTTAAMAAPSQPPAVAVLYFDYSGKSEELGALRKGLAEMLITDLAGAKAVTIVERTRL